jgi:hypothetical protein
MGCLRLTYEKKTLSPLKVVYRENLCINEKREWNSNSIDPYEQYHSPYLSMGNQWHMSVDKNGGWSSPDDFVFNENGDFVRIDVNDLPDRLVVENSISGSKSFFSFGDPINDPAQIRAGIINKLIFVSKSEVAGMLAEQGGFNPDNANPFTFYEKSKGMGDFDYSHTELPFKYFNEGASQSPNNPLTPSALLFLVEGEPFVQNQANFGNFLWGATGSSLGYTTIDLMKGGHLNSLLNSKSNGYSSQWDSADDQLSIFAGSEFAKRNKYNNITVRISNILNGNK